MSDKLSEILADQKFCYLTTFKKSGEEVSSPMWFVLKDETVYMTTRGQSWKVKRIKRDPRVKIAWSNGAGTRHGRRVDAVAEIITDGEEFDRAVSLLDKRYGMQKKLVDFGLRFARDKTEAILKVTISEQVEESHGNQDSSL